MNSLGKDIKAVLFSMFALQSTSATAGGSGDATEVNGTTIDLTQVPGSPNSVVFELPFRAVLGAANTGKITANLQDSPNGSDWTDITAPADILLLTGKSGGSTELGVARIGFDLTKARRYIRIQATPDLSAANTDTAVMGGGVATFGWLNEVPQ